MSRPRAEEEVTEEVSYTLSLDYVCVSIKRLAGEG